MLKVPSLTIMLQRLSNMLVSAPYVIVMDLTLWMNRTPYIEITKKWLFKKLQVQFHQVEFPDKKKSSFWTT